MIAPAVLDRRRAQMGASIASWPTGDRAVTGAGDGWWLMLSGAPSADANIALVYASDAEVLRDVVAQIEHAGLPTLLLTAGDAPTGVLSERWSNVGTMPFMIAELPDTPSTTGARARRAVASDVDTVVDLLADAYDVQPEVAAALVEPVLRPDGPIAFWLLEDAATPVSTIMTARHEDVVTLWCMATRRQDRRRGHGRALLAHVLAAASSDGAQVGLLGATPDGEGLYRATGWQALEDWRVWSDAPSVQFGH